MKKALPKIVKDVQEQYMKMGYNKSQATSIGWSEFFEEKAAILEARYRGNVSDDSKYDCYCFDCKKGNQFGAASSIRLFIQEHKDHKTKTFRIRG